MRASLVLALLLTACAPELGECDPVAAATVVYGQSDGLPSYEGQALMVASCGYGSFCHGAATLGVDDRLGVPAGLELDVRLAANDGAVDEAEILRLRRSRFRIVQEAHPLFGTIAQGTMPPRGGVAEDIWQGRPRYETVDGVAIAELDSPEGRATLQNWLACGAPVIERPLPRDDGVPSVNFPAVVRAPIEPTWASVYEDLLQGRGCARVVCHGGNDAGLRVTSAADTYSALVGAAGSGDECGGMGTLVVAGEPGQSLLLAKLRGGEVCGDAMPPNGRLPEEDLAAVEQWIADGASM